MSRRPPRLTARLALVPFTAQLARLALDDRPGLASALDAGVPAEWPNPELGEALPFFVEALTEAPELADWIALAVDREARVLVGSGGFVSLPDETGAVELGFGVIPAFRRRGYASEMSAGMIARAFEDARVAGVRARCEPDNRPSIGVLTRLGFTRQGEADGHLLWWLAAPG